MPYMNQTHQGFAKTDTVKTLTQNFNIEIISCDLNLRVMYWDVDGTAFNF